MEKRREATKILKREENRKEKRRKMGRKRME
jgi:hypothetical protein